MDELNHAPQNENKNSLGIKSYSNCYYNYDDDDV